MWLVIKGTDEMSLQSNGAVVGRQANSQYILTDKSFKAFVQKDIKGYTLAFDKSNLLRNGGVGVSYIGYKVPKGIDNVDDAQLFVESHLGDVDSREFQIDIVATNGQIHDNNGIVGSMSTVDTIKHFKEIVKEF